mmetsp:Transcript_38690/g.64182  ORF Transcript_38690/g.64182 Transcript_38690/m.64182 type:complete len:220 (-) Transcript_38690:131-790(-)
MQFRISPPRFGHSVPLTLHRVRARPGQAAIAATGVETLRELLGCAARAQPPPAAAERGQDLIVVETVQSASLAAARAAASRACQLRWVLLAMLGGIVQAAALVGHVPVPAACARLANTSEEGGVPHSRAASAARFPLYACQTDAVATMVPATHQGQQASGLTRARRAPRCTRPTAYAVTRHPPLLNLLEQWKPLDAALLQLCTSQQHTCVQTVKFGWLQ